MFENEEMKMAINTIEMLQLYCENIFLKYSYFTFKYYLFCLIIQ